MRNLPIFLTAALLTLSAPSQETCSRTQTPQQIDARIDALIAQMTVEERIAQMQDEATAIPRLHLPAYGWWNEGLHGIARNGFATVFPQAIGLAATFDPELLAVVGDTVSSEARAKFNQHSHFEDSPRYGGLTIWSPNINIFRDPRWGRGQETYGEDPFLTRTLGRSFVQGIQGTDAFYFKAIATPKHFAAHSGPESGRFGFNTVASPHDLADTYLPSFHTLTETSGSLMCSYNAINGIPSCANDTILKERLRDLWHFSGFVVSDCDAVGNIAHYHHFAPDDAHGAALALRAGTDLDCGNTYAALNQSLSQHLISGSDINRSLRRLLLARIRLGLLDPAGCSPYDRITPADNDTAAHREFALRAAHESIVLLQNDGILPLTSTKKNIAVVGPTADLLQILEANYHGTASHPVTPLDGLLGRFPDTHYAQGSLLADGLFLPIPRTALRTSIAPDAPQGLKAEYFAQASLDGTPAMTKTVPNINFDLNRATPDPSLPAITYAARWTGFFVPPAPGRYTLLVNANCGDCRTNNIIRFYLDGKFLSNTPDAKNKQAAKPIVLNLSDTQPHALRLEMIHAGDAEGLSLEWQPPAAALLEEAVASAQKSDMIIAFVGLSPDLEGEDLGNHLDGFEDGDRTSLDLPAPQRALLARLETLHKPLVIVFNSGSAVAIDPDHHANAVLAAWYPGEEGGNAIADIITGAVNPSGRLPVTFYRSIADLPPFADYSMAHRTYRYFSGPALYPFGFGLSYTKFKYAKLSVAQPTIHAGDSVTVTVTLTNAGTRAGDEVAELYLAPPQQPGMPRLTLQGIHRVTLASNQSRTLTFTLEPSQLSFVDPTGHRAVRSGDYSLYIGSTQPTASQPSATLHITGEKAFDF